MTGAMTPLPYRVLNRRVETADTVTLDLAPVAEPIGPLAPGQFTMVYAFGVGEVPISVSADPGAGRVTHTLRSVGAVTKALFDSPAGRGGRTAWTVRNELGRTGTGRRRLCPGGRRHRTCPPATCAGSRDRTP